MGLEQPLFNPQIRITVIYVAAATLWIFFSDLILLAVLPVTGSQIASLSILKGLAFVAVTGGLLFMFVRREISRREEIERSLKKEIQQSAAYQSALESSEARYRLLVEKSPYAIAIHQDGQLKFVNEAAVNMIRAPSADELLGLSIEDFVHPDGWAAAAARIQRMAAGEEGLYPTEDRYVRRDGSVIDVEVTAAPFTYEGRSAIQVIALDISQRKALETIARQTTNQFRYLAENIPEVFFLNDATKNQLLYISPAYQEIWGRSVDSVYDNPRSFLEGIHPDDRPAVAATFEQQIRGEPIEVTYRVLRPDHSVRWVRSRTFPVFDDQGQLIRIAGIAEDITVIKRQEAQLRRLTQQLVSALDNERARIARDLHDQIGQQLTALGLNIGFIETLSQDFAQISRIAADSAALVSETIEQIRFIISNLRPPILDDMELAAILRWQCEKFKRRTGIHVDLSLPLEEILVNKLVKTTLFYFVQEAFNNIARHAQATRVQLLVEPQEKSIKLTVRDNGRGFDVKQALSDGKIDSWGLQIMRERLDAVVGGRLSVFSQPEKGTQLTAEVTL